VATRTSEDQVSAVIDVSSGDDLTAYIDTANTLVTERCTASGYSDLRLELIERWLTAHFYACNRRRTLQEGVSGGANEGFDPIKTDLFFDNTVYGQQALMLDTAGNLAALQNAMKTVKIHLPAGGKPRTSWLGKSCP
jgi:hypothetical protein